MHNSFTLNGNSFELEEELIDFSISISKSLYSFLQVWFDDNDFVVVHTSGSTGKPKPIKIKKQFMRNSAKATGAFFELDKNTRALCCLSIDYIAGKMMMVRALELGWKLDVVAPSSNPLEDVFETYDFAAMVPMQVKASLWDLPQVKKLIIGGGGVSKGLEEALQSLKTECFATYGMTETVSHIAIKKLISTRLDDQNVTLSDVEVTKNRPETSVEKSFFNVLPNIKITTDERDCLVIDAPQLNHEKVITNDIVKIHSTTEFEWLGRYDNVINSGGVKLHPEQIEKKLSKFISQRFFVVGIPDQVLGNKLVLVIEGEEKEIDLSSCSLDPYENPKGIFFVDEFIETETKKIQRKKTLDLVLFK